MRLPCAIVTEYLSLYSEVFLTQRLPVLVFVINVVLHNGLTTFSYRVFLYWTLGKKANQRTVIA